MHEIRKGAIVHESLPPLDVRVVAYGLYFFGFLELAVGLLTSIGSARYTDHESRRVLLGTTVLASGSAEAIYTSCMGATTLFCAWGLIRRIKFVWWFAVTFFIYGWIDTALSFSRLYSRSPLSMVGSIVLGISFFVWLRYRRELYGVHLGARRKSKGEE